MPRTGGRERRCNPRRGGTEIVSTSKIAKKKLELYDLQGGKIDDAAGEETMEARPEPTATIQSDSHAEQIFRAAVALAGKDGRNTFSRKSVRDHIGLTNMSWQSGYTAVFQGMRDDHPGGAPMVAAEYRGVLHRVSPGIYELSAKGRRRANSVRLTD
jgi:hypothetical protein